jgi:anti-sigma B factor antagonist
MIDASQPAGRDQPEVVLPAAFRCEVVFTDEHAVVSVHGDLDVATAPTLLRESFAALALPIAGLTLDLEGTTFMDSSGLDALLQAQRHGRDLGIAVDLKAVPPQPLRVIELTGLTELLDAHA